MDIVGDKQKLTKTLVKPIVNSDFHTNDASHVAVLFTVESSTELVD